MTLSLLLSRRWFTPTSTIGQLSGFPTSGVPAWLYTLEDVVRPEGSPKVPGATAIPSGTYPIIITPSTRFKRPLPLLLDVPNFSGIRIHPGNAPEDTEGCILVGMGRGPRADWISRSQDAFAVLFPALVKACGEGKVTITIENQGA